MTLLTQVRQKNIRIYGLLMTEKDRKQVYLSVLMHYVREQGLTLSSNSFPYLFICCIRSKFIFTESVLSMATPTYVMADNQISRSSGQLFFASSEFEW